MTLEPKLEARFTLIFSDDEKKQRAARELLGMGRAECINETVKSLEENSSRLLPGLDLVTPEGRLAACRVYYGDILFLLYRHQPGPAQSLSPFSVH